MSNSAHGLSDAYAYASTAPTPTSAFPLPAEQQHATEPRQGLAPRRGKQLHINTDIPVRTPPVNPIPGIERPPPVETIIYKTSPDQTTLPEFAPAQTPRRASRLGLRGIFGRNKSSRSIKHDSQPESITEEADVSSKVSSESPFFAPPPREPAKEKVAPAKLKSAKKERAPRTLTSWDPPPFFQVHPQAVKAGTLDTSAQPAEAVLRLDKLRRAHEEKTIPGPQLVADWHDYPSDEETNEAKKSHRRQPSNFVECTTKMFVLTTSGFLLQYANEGSHDRLPEKIMQLGKDSAAFASDAIPGKHWVLQMSQSFSEDGIAFNEARKSIFPRFGIGGNMKRSVSNLLLVMNNAEDMNSWLVTLRREIQGFGGKTYRPDEPILDTSKDAMQRLRDRPSRRFLIERSTSQNSSHASPISPILSHRSSTVLSQSRQAYAAESLSTRRSFNSQRSGESMARSPGLSLEDVLLQRSLDQPRSNDSLRPPLIASGPDVDKALPERPPSEPISPLNARSPVNALGIISTQPSNARSPSRKQDDYDRTLGQADSLLRPKHVSQVTVSYHNAEDRLSNEDSVARKCSIGSCDSGRAPNFSVPSFSRRYSHMKHSSAETVASSGSTTTSVSRGRTPSLTDDGISTRPESIIGELPPSARTLQRPNFQGQAELAVAVSMSPARAKAVENELPELVTVPPEHQAVIPKRLSSLEYSHGTLPWNTLPDSATLASARSTSCSPRPYRFSSLGAPNFSNVGTPLLQPPFPPPTASLPPLPPSAVASMEPSPKHTLSGDPSPSIPSSSLAPSPPRLRQAKSTGSHHEGSPRKVKPISSTPTLKLPVAPPLTIQERRMLYNRSGPDLGPPALPPPSGALPPPPGAPPSIPLPPVPVVEALGGSQQMQRNVETYHTIPSSAGPAAPLTPPTHETPPSQPRPTFEEARELRLPDSPPSLEQHVGMPHNRNENKQFSPLRSGLDYQQEVLRQQTRNQWGVQLRRVGA